jgi:flagellar hook-basal body complex protein FliE
MMLDAISGVGFRDGLTPPVGGVSPASPLAKGVGKIGDGGDFAAMLGVAITEFSDKLKQAEAVSIGGVKGTASLQDVVERVMSAEQSLQAVIAVRDKVVSAYQEISRMAI